MQIHIWIYKENTISKYEILVKTKTFLYQDNNFKKDNYCIDCFV